MKKQWISVKCGLSRDPKHRQRMGESIWLFLHILDVASWDDGIAHEWKDEAAAEEMGIPVRTLREHRRKLSDEGYITCLQKQYTQDIVIHNWTNPREYSGEIRNKKQGDSETEPKETNQGYTQGYTQGSTKDVTPTSYSNIKESTEARDNSEPAKEQSAEEYNAELFRGDPNEYPEHIREIAKVLRDTWLFVLPPKTKGKRGKQYGFYISSMESLKQSCGEFGAEVLVKLHADWRAGFKNGIAPYTIANPQSLVNVASGKAREMREAKSGATPQSVKLDNSGAPITY